MERVTFCIPLVSRRIARDWETAQRLLSTTLNSIFNQDHSDIFVLVACHETPDIQEILDPRVAVINVNFDIPRFRSEMEIDRKRKLEVLGMELRARGGGLQFVMDADDYVSKSLATEICESATKVVVVDGGYRLDACSGDYQVMRQIWKKCGSCIAVKWAVDELPQIFPSDAAPLYHRFCDLMHFDLPGYFKSQGWSMMYLKNPLITYVINHGVNISDVIIRSNLRRRLYFRVLPRREWTSVLDGEFGVTAERRSANVYRGTALFATQFGG